MSVFLCFLMGSGVQAEEKKGGMCSMCKMHQQKQPAQADPGHYVPHLLKHAKEIGLKAEDISKLKALQLNMERTRLKTDAEVQIVGLELDALVEDEQADFSAIEAKVKQKAALVAGLELATIKTKREALALLTPDQREKEQAVHEKMTVGMMERMHSKPSEGAPGGKAEHRH
jgi:Spy/CpxP family protein refolding chaperone